MAATVKRISAGNYQVTRNGETYNVRAFGDAWFTEKYGAVMSQTSTLALAKQYISAGSYDYVTRETAENVISF